MSKRREQFCGNCGNSVGVFEWSQRFDSPLSCGARDCERAARDEERERDDEARNRAAEDDYGLYR